MKEIVKFEQEVGGDGAVAMGILGVEASSLKFQVSVTYPLQKLAEPVNKAIDSAFDMVKDTIPGNWEDAMVDGFKAKIKEELIKLLSE